MDALQTLTLGAGLSTGLAALTVLLLRSSFLQLLLDLCRSDTYGRFWFVLACVSIVLTTLFASLVPLPGRMVFSPGEEPAIEILLVSFRAGLLGLLLSLAAVAFVVLVSIGQRGIASAPPRLPVSPDPRPPQ